MRLYGVLTTLGAAGAICLIATHPAYAETSTGRSLLLAQQNKNKLTIAKKTPLLAAHDKKALLAKPTKSKPAELMTIKPKNQRLHQRTNLTRQNQSNNQPTR